MHTSCSSIGWCVMCHELQSFTQGLKFLYIHQWVHEWGWSTIVQVTKQGDHLHTDNTTPKIFTWLDRWKLGHFHPFIGLTWYYDTICKQADGSRCGKIWREFVFDKIKDVLEIEWDLEWHVTLVLALEQSNERYQSVHCVKCATRM